MGIPWDGKDGTGMNCYGMGWDGTEKYVPWTSLPIAYDAIFEFLAYLVMLIYLKNQYAQL